MAGLGNRWTPEMFADRLGIHERTVRRWIKSAR